MTKSSFFKILKKIIFAFFMILTFIIILTLYRCGYFKPQSKVIQYQEEVKLSNGEMIWVDIKRHYWLTGEIGVKPAYMPGIVEISWDTGFEGVGRQSVFFSRQVFLIDKIGEIWYIAGVKNDHFLTQLNDGSVSCTSIGLLFGDNGCIVAVDKSGKFLNISRNDLNGVKNNIFYPVNTEDLKSVTNSSYYSKLSWSDKLNLQSLKPKKYQFIGRTW